MLILALGPAFVDHSPSLRVRTRRCSGFDGDAGVDHASGLRHCQEIMITGEGRPRFDFALTWLADEGIVDEEGPAGGDGTGRQH